jgi:hypothetical protein
MMKLMKLLGGVLLAGALAACGGGGGSPGATPGNGGANGPSPTSKVADFSVLFNKTTLTSGGTDSAIVTVVAVDSGGNIVSGATVTVASGVGTIFTPAGGPTTDSTGTYKGSVALGSDKSDRTINVSVSSNGITRNTTLIVTGSKLTLQASPTSPSPGQAVSLTMQLNDGSGAGIPNAVITLGGSVPGLAGTQRTTDANGKATLGFNAPTVAGIYQLSAVGNGVSSGDYQLQVFSTVIPPAVIPAGVAPALSASPNVIAANSPGSSTNRSTIRFLMLNAQNGPVANVRVKFVDVTSGLPVVGSSLANAGVTLFTDASGSVATDYVSGQNPSPTNGVRILACYSGTDFTSASDCPNSVAASLTVAGQALAVSIGDDNLLTKGEGTYIKKFVISVGDAAGKPVANAPVDISVDLTHYGKAGSLASGTTTFNGVPTSLTGSASLDITSSTSGSGSGTASTTATFRFVWCPNEDTNRNGFVDPGENVNGTTDTNGQPTLEPRKSDLLISYTDPTKTVTDASGLLSIQVQYSQRFATWLAYRVRVIASVQGSQGINERLFVSNFVEGDQVNGSFLLPPYGSNPSCTAPN